MNLKIVRFVSINHSTSRFEIIVASFMAKNLIIFFPLVFIMLFFFKNEVLLYKISFSITTSLVISYFIKLFFYIERPFVLDERYDIFFHKRDSSFPSNHGSVAFTFSFCLSICSWIGSLMFIFSIIISLSRIFLRIHRMSDVIGSILISFISYKINSLILINYIIYVKKYIDAITIF
ncbi:hypothetical protein AOQ88_00595 [Candidatus Riesia sp. GBBU]|nr:hypothetical protein AOQ88_00595 [Candidatus Riesia sp. GBBU]